MLRPYQNPTASTSTLLAQTLRRFFRRPLLHPPVLPELGVGRAHVVRDLALLAQRRDHRLRLLGMELERARLRDRLIEQRLLAAETLHPRLHVRQHRLRPREALLGLLHLALAMIETVRRVVHVGHHAE